MNSTGMSLKRIEMNLSLKRISTRNEFSKWILLEGSSNWFEWNNFEISNEPLWRESLQNEFGWKFQLETLVESIKSRG